MQLRQALTSDAPAIAAIYAHEVESGHATFDTTPPPDDYWVGRIADTGTGIHFLVAEDPGRLLGYAYSSVYRPRGAYARTRESTVYLAPDAQGRGVGRALYTELLDRLRADGTHAVLAVIAVPNEASVALHRRFGFRLAGTLAEVGHKFGRWRDVQFWQLLLEESDLAQRAGQ